jgi:hypothetical protein
VNNAVTEKTETLEHEASFTELGGRISPDSDLPTVQEWVERAAVPADLIFHEDAEVEKFFAAHFSRLNDIVRNTTATRETVVAKLMGIAGNRPDLVSAVDFKRVPTRSTDDSYAPPHVMAGKEPLSTFEATVTCAPDPNRPKLSISEIEVGDHVVKGLEAPHAIYVALKTPLQPWIVGSPAARISLTIPGKDSAASPVEINSLYRFADPEALEQTLDFCVELAEELFSNPEDKASS